VPETPFASQVAERGLAFVKAFSDILAAQAAEGATPPLFREAWAFSACAALANATSAMVAGRAGAWPGPGAARPHHHQQ